VSKVSEEIQRRLEAAIPEAFSAEGGFVTKWLVIAETIGPDSERGLWTRTSPDLKPWDSLGMMRFAEAVELDGAIEQDGDDED
jgi:hypothetical protein